VAKQTHSPLQHHFTSLSQQYAASQLGMWTFLLTELLFFGGLFLSYTIYRMSYPHGFAAASHELDVRLGCINTIVLISSSLTMALAVRAGHEGKGKSITGFLVLTMALGGTFLGIKSIEYAHKFHEHFVPGPNFAFPHYASQGPELFFSLYFAMTGLHAIHMIIGLVALGVVAWKATRGRYTKEYSTPVEMLGLYWHFVDIVWIFLFPLLYLLGRH
jgi:cytochrome c oxidase subunit 3